MKKFYKLFISPVFLISVLSVILLGLTTQCKKDPVKGWDFYFAPPPPPKIININAIIKDCVPDYPVTFYPRVENLLGTVSYNWDFGDGNVSTDIFPTNYFEQGDYTIRLIVSNEIGADTAYLPMPELNESSIPVKAEFTYSRYNNNSFAPNKILFDNISVAASDFYWYFDDGNESNHDNPVHIFQEEGDYFVKLRATCSNGTFDETTVPVFVNAPPKRVFIDSINLMLPSGYKNNRLYFEFYHNTLFAGYTRILIPSSFPVRFKRPTDIYDGFFYAEFNSNEYFKFVLLRDNGDDPPTWLFEFALAAVDIQNNFYPRSYYQIETLPSIDDVFIDLYISY